MLEAIRTWIMGIAAAAVFCALANELTPKGAVKNVLGAVCGIVMALALVSPLLSLDFSAYSLNTARYKAEAEGISNYGEEISNRYQRTIIEESSAAYILDKAEGLSLNITGASVHAQWSEEGYWYPVQAEITGGYDKTLSDFIESELGIKGEMQYWSENEDN